MFNARGKMAPTCRGSQVDEILNTEQRDVKKRSVFVWFEVWTSLSCEAKHSHLIFWEMYAKPDCQISSIKIRTRHKYLGGWKCVEIWKNKLSFIRNSLGENSGRCMFFFFFIWWWVKFWGQRPSARVWNVIKFQIHSQSWQICTFASNFWQ